MSAKIGIVVGVKQLEAPGTEARATLSEAQYASNLALAC